jgi:hypothetical protein
MLFIMALTVRPGLPQQAGIGFKNQLSGWGGVNFSTPVESQAGLRYIPQLSPWYESRKLGRLDAELSANLFGNLRFEETAYDTATYDLKPYRLWLRYSTNRLEIRAGLQKISFGSASILRPLMWFDKMDFRDPLQLTDGVYGVLGRYFFSNNINIWLWSLYGNEKTKGWELVPTVEGQPEYGGRIQTPFPRGEIALSYHYRRADFSSLYALIPFQTETAFNENQFAFDGKWDLGVGLWFEGVARLNDEENQLLSRWETNYVIGMDYTFPLGRGLQFMTEYFHYSNHPDDGVAEVKRNYSAAVLSYPLSIAHTVSGMVYYDWDTDEWYRFVTLQMRYDHLSVHLMAFWNPEDAGLFNIGRDDPGLFAGKGFQLMLVLDI